MNETPATPVFFILLYLYRAAISHYFEESIVKTKDYLLE